MTTYHGERAYRLERSLESIYQQTHPVDQLVLVLDGPIDAEQEEVIARYERDQRVTQMSIVRLPNNVGLGAALQIGWQHCRGTWVARMDSDDISLPDRIKVQMEYIQEHPEIDLVGGWCEEFVEGSSVTRYKTAPEDAAALLRMLRWRNVIVHPSVVMRAATVERVGGFRGDFPLLEDWDLFVRLALGGARMVVLPHVVIRVRTSRDQANRRGGWIHAKSDVRFRTSCWRRGFLGFPSYVVCTTGFAVYRLAGPSVRGYLYRFVRRRTA
jgi:glycosyltransferase involved in cell wall biosynthesis